MIIRQRQEAVRVQRCLEEEKARLQNNPPEDKQRMKQLQKDAVYSYFSKVSGVIKICNTNVRPLIFFIGKNRGNSDDNLGEKKIKKKKKYFKKNI